MGILIAAVVLLSIMVAVLGVTLRHVNTAVAQPCVGQPTPGPTASVGAGDSPLPSANSMASPLATPGTGVSSPVEPAKPVSVPPAALPATSSSQAPPDVLAYLKFVQSIDQKRLALMANPAASEPSTDGASTTPNDWPGILSEFQSHTMPESCGAFGNEYLQFLTHCQAVVGKPEDQVATVAAEAAKVDKDLEQLCLQTLHLPKPFTVTMPSTMMPAPAPAPTQ